LKAGKDLQLKKIAIEEDVLLLLVVEFSLLLKANVKM
jgi:hypothetical protein